MAAGALALLAGIFTVLVTTIAGRGGAATAAPAGLQQVKHVVVIYLENWSFDSLYGNFPGADGLAQAAAPHRRSTRAGRPTPPCPSPWPAPPGPPPPIRRWPRTRR